MEILTKQAAVETALFEKNTQKQPVLRKKIVIPGKIVILFVDGMAWSLSAGFVVLLEPQGDSLEDAFIF